MHGEHDSEAEGRAAAAAVAEVAEVAEAAGDRASEVFQAALRDGSRLALERTREHDRVRLLDAEGAALIEYDTRTGSVRLASPRGDLVLAAPKGHVRVEAARGFSVRTRGACELSSEARGEAPESDAHARLRLEGDRATLRAGRAQVRANELHADAELVKTVARKIESTAESVRVLAGVLESRATRVLSHAVHVYQEVDEQVQLRAGRVRTIARDAWHVFGKRSFLGAEEEVKIDGENIRLG